MPSDHDLPLVFDRLLKRVHRDRAASMSGGRDILLLEATDRIAERLENDFLRSFPFMLELGCRRGILSRRLMESGKVANCILADSSLRMLRGAPGIRIAADEESLPFAQDCFDLITSVLNLHWVNDLPGCLVQIYRALKKDGLFLASMLGGATMHEFRQAAIAAEMELTGGASARVIPFFDVKEAAHLLQRAGFGLPVADTETVTIMYNDIFTLMHDLRRIGETSALLQRSRHYASRELFSKIAEKYGSMFANVEGKLPATFELITMTGWK